jgi:hypothetical protein
MRAYTLFIAVAALAVLVMAAAASGEMIGVQTTGTATQSSNYDTGNTYPASNGKDGDYATHQDTGYSASQTTQYWEVAFDAETAIDSVWTHYRDQGSSGATLRKRAYSLTCTIYNADNVVVYTSPVFNPEANPLVDPGYGPWKLNLAAPVMGKKVRITKQCGSTQTLQTRCLHCNEIEVRHEDGLTGENVAQGRPVTVFGDDYYHSTSYNTVPANLTDGTIGTYCSSDTDVPDPNTFGYLINLGQSYGLQEMKIYPRQEAAFVAGGAWDMRLGDYVVSLYDDDNGAPAATANWTATRTGDYFTGLGIGDKFTASMGSGTFAGQWIKIEATDLHLDNNAYGTHPRGYCCLQIAEVRAFIPEPSTLALLIGGVLGMLVRRRGREW